VAVFTNLQPVVTATASWLLFGEVISARLFAGGTLVIAGVFVTTRTEPRMKPAGAGVVS
jgi:drug/metabolite transporter (DMT)-like permease